MIATNISEFRSNIKLYVDKVLSDGSAVLINRGNSAAVLISLDEYNAIKETESAMYKAELPEEISNGISALDTGESVTVNIDEL